MTHVTGSNACGWYLEHIWVCLVHFEGVLAFIGAENCHIAQQVHRLREPGERKRACISEPASESPGGVYNQVSSPVGASGLHSERSSAARVLAVPKRTPTQEV